MIEDGPTMNEHALALEVLREFLRERISRHELPVALDIRDSLPHAPVGKLSRKELANEKRNRAAST
jgi:long-chain acyl-CoA synthetase